MDPVNLVVRTLDSVVVEVKALVAGFQKWLLEIVARAVLARVNIGGWDKGKRVMSDRSLSIEYNMFFLFYLQVFHLRFATHRWPRVPLFLRFSAFLFFVLDALFGNYPDLSVFFTLLPHAVYPIV